jgi:TatD DNase family protein
VLADTHCHLDSDAFDDDRAEVLQRARAAGVEQILVPAVDLPSARRIVELVGADHQLFAAIGCHPTQAAGWAASTASELRSLAHHSSVVAVGEIGLDYYRDASPREIQRTVLIEQLAMAEELKLPVIVHMREPGDAAGGPCADHLLEALTDWTDHLRQRRSPLALRPGVLHSFSGSLETALRAIELGFCIGVTGPVTFKNAHQRRDVVASLPLDCLLIETDSPYLAPVPHRGRRNEPAYLVHIADRIAQMRSIEVIQLSEVTSQSAARLFQWGARS